MVIVPVVLAGGIGERFWPASRSTYPKQLLKLTGSISMIEKTLRRIAPLVKKPVKPLIITGEKIIPSLKKVLPASLGYDLIIEKQGKNTAPAICLAASWIANKYGDAVMIILSADHEIGPARDFVAAIRSAVQYATQHDTLVIFGITPDRPDTGYGYLKIGKQVSTPASVVKLFQVNQFVEKPTLAKAKDYFSKKTYLWNSGMFVWKTSTILREFQSSLPNIYNLAMKARREKFTRKAIDRFYLEAESISVDYGIMEHASDVYAVVGSFAWDDIGSWEAMSRLYPKDSSGTVSAGKQIIAYDCNDTLIYNKTATAVAAIGLKNTSIIVADGVVLVINREKLPEFKQYLNKIKSSGKIAERLF